MNIAADTVRSEDLFKVLDVARSLVTRRNLDDILNLIIESSCDVLRADRASVFLVDEIKQELYIRVAKGEEMLEIHFPIDKGIAGHVATNGETLNIPNAYDDARFNADVDKKTGYKTKSILTMALDTGDKIVGVIQVINKENDLAFDDYDKNVLGALAAQAAVSINDYWMNSEMLNKKSMEASLDIARTIQKSFLPDKPPEIDSLDIFAYSESCDETGGDYYDYYLLDAETLMVVVGDVTGHGVGSSLLMASTRSALHALWLTSKDPQYLLETLNNLIEKDMGDDRFITIFLGVFDMRRQLLTYSSAGHDAPILYRAADDFFEEFESTGIPLGMMSDMNFPTRQVYLKPKDTIYMMTDGVWEAMNNEHETYGQERLMKYIKDNDGKSAEESCHGLINEVTSFCDGAPVRDDITLLIMHVKNMCKGIKILRQDELLHFDEILLSEEIPSVTEDKSNLLDNIIKLMLEKELLEDISGFTLHLCLDEAIVNALEHGNNSDPHKKIKVVVSASDEYWSITIEDEGEGFEDFEVPDPEDPSSLELDHGRGLLIMTSFLNALWYNKKGNAVQMIRRRGKVRS